MITVLTRRPIAQCAGSCATTLRDQFNIPPKGHPHVWAVYIYIPRNSPLAEIFPFPQRRKFPPLFGKDAGDEGKRPSQEKRRRRNATVRCPRRTQLPMVANVSAIVPTDARFKGRRHQTIFTQRVLPAIVSLARPDVSVRLGRWQTPCRSRAGLQSATSQTLIKGGWTPIVFRPGVFRPFPREIPPVFWGIPPVSRGIPPALRP